MSRPRVCQHCREFGPHYARGLCRPCYRAQRDFYAHLERKGRKHVYPGQFPDTYVRRALPARPTDAEPGSEAKIQVLIARLAARVSLHHPRDRRWGMEPVRLPVDGFRFVG